MNRIDEAFVRLKEEGGLGLIPFITVGDPELDATIDILAELERAGADIVELGVPYSDPLADGPVIQRASERALRHRVSIVDVIETAGKARARGIRLPFILFTYYNPVLQLGLDRFYELLAANGISGTIIPDLPLEEDAPVRARAEKAGIHLIPLVAPTSDRRVSAIAAKAHGFVYCVSSLGVTGERAQFFSGIDDFLATVKRSASVPICVGFGISGREQVQGFAGKCDGVIVGSAIVRKIEELGPRLQAPDRRKDALAELGAFVKQLKL